MNECRKKVIWLVLIISDGKQLSSLNNVSRKNLYQSPVLEIVIVFNAKCRMYYLIYKKSSVIQFKDGIMI